MADPRRVARLQQFILEVAAVAVQRELRDPRLGFVTVTRVKLSPDLAEANVYWSALGTEAQRRTSARALADATPVIQSIVAKALQTRTTPTLTFRPDDTLVEAERLEGIFEKLKHEGGAPDAEAAPAAEPTTGEAAQGDDAVPADDAAVEPGAEASTEPAEEPKKPWARKKPRREV
jgi:ribosome-binding factor A